MNVLKIFATGKDRRALKEIAEPFEEYDAFALVKASPATKKKLARKFALEDITDQYTIPLESTEIKTPPRGTRPQTATARRVLGPPDRKPHHYLVQFVGPVKQPWLKGVKKAGGEVRQPYEGFAYVVRVNQAGADKIRQLPFVRWVGHLPPDQRIERNVRAVHGDDAQTLPRTRVLEGAYVVEFFGPEDAKRAQAEIKQLGFDILTPKAKTDTLVVRHEGSEAQQKKAVEELSTVHGVRMISERTLDRLSNNVATGIMRAEKSVGNPGLGLDGSGEVVGICDTGLDTGDAATIHGDFAGRIALIKSYPITPELNSYLKNPQGDDGAADLDSGHGTHVAGSVLGDGTLSADIDDLAAPVRGLATKAKLVFQAVEQETRWKSAADRAEYGRYGLWGIPGDLNDLFADAYRAKARIHSNSWGGGKPGEYDEQCRQLDEFVWDHKDFCVLVAAGNDGTDADGDGKINPMSVTSPATAKNCITIGASENKRTEFNTERYGDWWPDDYPEPPFSKDPMANNQEHLAAFSSRGPTKDGRIKPDLVAPGTFILSTRSTQIAANNQAWAAFPPSRAYFHMGGTSMATPLAAGAAVIVRQYLRKKQRMGRPSAALIKAALIAGATRLRGSAAGTVCDNDQGYGRINLDAVLAVRSPAAARFVDVKQGLTTGKMRTYDLTVESSAAPLRIVMAYSDFPGPKLVNNLNLIVTSPDGTNYTGNNARPGSLQMDVINNVEAIRIAKPAKGTWQVQVLGSNVPQGPQDYALVMLGAIE
jgi:subtilisin family serine protease